MWYTIVYIIEEIFHSLDEFIRNDISAWLFLPALAGFFIYFWTIVRGFVWKPQKNRSALDMRLRHLKSLYGVVMQVMILVTIGWFTFYIYIMYRVMEAWSTKPDWMYFVVENGEYLALIILWSAIMLFALRTVYYLRQEKRKQPPVISVWMVLKQEVMLPGSIITAILIGYVVAMLFYINIDHPNNTEYNNETSLGLVTSFDCAS